MPYYIVDTNMLLAANGRSTQLLRLPGCVTTSAEILTRIMNGDGVVVIDSSWLIVNEYRKNLRDERNPGQGFSFLNWLYRNQYDTEHCRQVNLTILGENEYAEFPNNDPALQNFDLSDRKFVALVLAHAQQYEAVMPIVLNATDSDWVEYESVLNSHGITIEFLCGRDLKADEIE